MASDVIHKLLNSMLANQVVLDAVRGGLPLKVVQTVLKVVSWLPPWKASLLAFSSLQTPTLLENPSDQPRVVARSNGVLQRLRLVLLESVF